MEKWKMCVSQFWAAFLCMFRLNFFFKGTVLLGYNGMYVSVCWWVFMYVYCRYITMHMYLIPCKCIWKLKNSLCLSFRMPCSQNLFYLYCFFHLGLFYRSGSQISWLPWSCSVCNYQGELLAFLFTTPFNSQKRKVNIYDFFATFCFIIVFCISAPTPVTLAAIYFLKGNRVAIFIYIILFYHYFPF